MITKREKSVLTYVVKGYTNKQIAKILDISYHTVKANVASLLKKAKVNSRVLLQQKKDYLMNDKKRVILIDLDGVLNEYTGNFDPNFIPPAKEEAEEFLKDLSQDFTLKLFTTRNLLLAGQWLSDNGLDKYFADITNIKVPCYLIADDRCVCFNGSYKDFKDKIKNYKVWFRQ